MIGATKAKRPYKDKKKKRNKKNDLAFTDLCVAF